MNRLLGNIRLQSKLFIIVAIAVFCLFIMEVFSVLTLRSNLLEEKKVKTKHVVETAYGIVDHHYKLFREGKLQEQPARLMAINALRALRYDEKEYFWINDMRPVMVMHPYKPEMEGKDLSEMADPKGKKIFVEFTNTVKNHKVGFVDYLWPKPEVKEPVPKISYVMGFSPWGWVIGSGIYIDDVNAIFWKKVVQSSMLFCAVVAVLLLLSWLIARNIKKPLQNLVEATDQLARGNTGITLEAATKDEIGILTSSFITMAENIRALVTDSKKACRCGGGGQHLDPGGRRKTPGRLQENSGRHK